MPFLLCHWGFSVVAETMVVVAIGKLNCWPLQLLQRPPWLVLGNLSEWKIDCIEKRFRLNCVIWPREKLATKWWWWWWAVIGWDRRIPVGIEMVEMVSVAPVFGHGRGNVTLSGLSDSGWLTFNPMSWFPNSVSLTIGGPSRPRIFFSNIFLLTMGFSIISELRLWRYCSRASSYEGKPETIVYEGSDSTSVVFSVFALQLW